jgi:hypothetical protein
MLTQERYHGERLALRSFLAAMARHLQAIMGGDALPPRQMERAVRVGDLETLRSAREVFHRLPKDVKHQAMRLLFESDGVSRHVSP